MGLKMVDFVKAYIELLCSYEFFVFGAFLREHPASRNKTLMTLLPSYTIKQWSDGLFSEEIIEASRDGLVDVYRLSVWAKSMILFETEFNRLGIFNPVSWLRRHDVIREHLQGLSWVETPGALSSKL